MIPPSMAMASLAGLPTELKILIVEIIHRSSQHRPHRGRQTDTLIPLSIISREWRVIILPYLFQEVTLLWETNRSISNFAAMVAPEYGAFCCSLRISLRTWDSFTEDELADMVRFESRGDFRKATATSVKWHAERSAMLSLIVRSMPNLKALEVFTDGCRWHPDLRRPCRCLAAYVNLSDALCHYPLRSIRVDFNSTWSSRDGSDKIVSNLLLNARETLEVVQLEHQQEEYSDDDFKLPLALEILERLPRLRDLRLWSVCSLAEISSCVWTSPLQALDLYPTPPDDDAPYDDAAAHSASENDISLMMTRLPDTVRHISLGWWHDAESCKHLMEAFPSGLATLESLVLGFPVNGILINYLRSSNIRTLQLEYEFESRALLKALADTTAFPCLQELVVMYPGGRPCSSDGKAVGLLRDACGQRGISIIFSG